MPDPRRSDDSSADELAAVPMTDAVIRELRARVRASGDAPLRRLVSEFVTLRRDTADVLAFTESREGGAAVANVPALPRARRLVAPSYPRRSRCTRIWKSGAPSWRRWV